MAGASPARSKMFDIGTPKQGGSNSNRGSQVRSGSKGAGGHGGPQLPMRSGSKGAGDSDLMISMTKRLT